jgi:hypothetical protein
VRLSREKIEMLRAGILDSEWCGYSKRNSINALCDLALQALDRPAERGELELAKAAIKAMAEDGWLYHGVEGMSKSQELCYEAYQKLGLKDLPDEMLRSKKLRALSPERTADARWIPVSERLPEKDDRVLLLDGDEIAFGCLCLIKNGTPYFEAENYGCDGASDSAPSVTHWQPLPPAPLKEPGR